MKVLLLVYLINVILFSSLCFGMQLRKHDQRITEPSAEEVILAASAIDTNTTTEHHTNTTIGCGMGTMICLTFASDSTDLPVKCGTLTNVPLCPTSGQQQQNKEECKVFCDSDGYVPCIKQNKSDHLMDLMSQR
jgi:hypothetical protein